MDSFTIDDDLKNADTGGIEVTVVVEGERRWCYFMTPNALSNAGDWVPGTEVRMHHAPHMIVVSELSKGIIEAVLHHLSDTGELRDCTRAFEAAS